MITLHKKQYKEENIRCISPLVEEEGKYTFSIEIYYSPMAYKWLDYRHSDRSSIEAFREEIIRRVINA